jgi:hypothetical protein
MAKFSLLRNSQFSIPEFGIYCLADHFHETGQSYRFVYSVGEAKEDEILCISVQNNKTMICNTRAKAVLVGGTGNLKLIGYQGPVVVFDGAAQNLGNFNIDSFDILEPGVSNWRGGWEVTCPSGCVPLVENIPIIPVYVGHGCDYGECSFCGVKPGWSCPPELAAEIISIANARNGIAKLSLENPSIDFFSKLSTCLIAGESHRWISYSRANIPVEVIKNMSASGCRGLIFGAEIFSDIGLKKIHKGVTVKQILQTIDDCISFGITPHVSLINFPSSIVGQDAIIEHNENLANICNEYKYNFARFYISNYVSNYKGS